MQKAAADAKAAQQRVETNLAEQQTRAAKAETELLQLQEAVKPRHLSAEKRARFISLLRQSPKLPVEARCMDMEGCAFAKEIEDALKEAGWEVRSSSGGMYAVMQTFFGLIVAQRNEGDPLPALDALYIALSDVGFTPRAVADPNQPDNVIVLAVGAKP